MLGSWQESWEAKMSLNSIRSDMWYWGTYKPFKLLPRPIWQWLLGTKYVGDFIFFIHSICPYHWCKTGRIDDWVTRRFCPKCNDWWDMG